MKEYDLIVLGTGGAGYQVAIKTAQAGWKVAAIDRGPFGGTCSVRGCIPKKVLAGTAEIADINRRLHGIGIVTQEPQMSWSELIKFKRTFTDPVPASTKKGLKEAGVDVFEGSPRFVSERELEIGSKKLSFKKAHIAVGLEPAKLPFEGFDHMIDSDAFLELDKLPKRVLFVGGGYVSFEFAHVAARFGAEVTILHTNDRPLPMFDADIIQTLCDASKEVGIKVELNARAQKIEKKGGVFTVSAGEGRTFEADLVVHGAGRVPAIKDMNLEAAQIEYDKKRGIAVNGFLQNTTNPHIYAAGDAAATGAPLTPLASVQGALVADNLLGKARKQPDYRSTASVVFTTPALASVGYQEEEAKAAGLACEPITTDLSTWFDSKRLDLKHAKSKILVEKESGKILGAHLIANHAEDLINFFSLAIEHGLTADQLKKPIFAFPTASDDIRSAF